MAYGTRRYGTGPYAGGPSATFAAPAVFPTGIPSEEAVGTPTIAVIVPTGIASAGAFGLPVVFSADAAPTAVAYLYENVGFLLVTDPNGIAYLYESVGASLSGEIVVGEFRDHPARRVRDAAAELYENVT